MLPGRQDKQSATASKHNAGADSEIKKKNEGETGAKDRLRIQSPALRLCLLISDTAADLQGTRRNVDVPVLSDRTRFSGNFLKFGSKIRPRILGECTQ